MTTRNFALCALGLAAAFTFGGADTASAQARSTTRIPVRKDTPMAMKVDTVTVFKTDTVTIRGRVDTMMGPMRFDTVMRMMSPPLGTMPRFEFGIGGGVATPMNNWRNSTKDGPAAHAHLGFFPGAGVFGIRFDGDAGFFAHRETDCATCPDPRVYSGSANIILRFPIDRQGNLNPILYAIGGGIDKFDKFLAYQANGAVVTAGRDTYTPFTAFPPPLPRGSGAAVAITAANRGTKSLFYHYDVGGGLELGRGNIRVFAEAKYMTINTDRLAFGTGATASGTNNSHYFPIVAGLNFTR